MLNTNKWNGYHEMLNQIRKRLWNRRSWPCQGVCLVSTLRVTIWEKYPNLRYLPGATTRHLRRDFVNNILNTAMNLWVPKKEGNFLAGWPTISFFRRTLLHGDFRGAQMGNGTNYRWTTSSIPNPPQDNKGKRRYQTDIYSPNGIRTQDPSVYTV
jgi:hypothetical protein